MKISFLSLDGGLPSKEVNDSILNLSFFDFSEKRWHMTFSSHNFCVESNLCFFLKPWFGQIANYKFNLVECFPGKYWMAISECIWKKKNTRITRSHFIYVLCIIRLFLVQSKGLNVPRRKNGKLDLVSNVFQHKTIWDHLLSKQKTTVKVKLQTNIGVQFPQVQT